MKKYAAYFLLALAIIFFLTGCEDQGADVIITEGSIPFFSTLPLRRHLKILQ